VVQVAHAVPTDPADQDNIHAHHVQAVHQVWVKVQSAINFL